MSVATLDTGARAPRAGRSPRRHRIGVVTEISAMPTFGILATVTRLIVAIFAGLGTAATEWVPPVERLERSERA